MKVFNKSIITLKFKYEAEEKDLILSYIKNYNSVLRFTYNRMKEGIKSTKELTQKQSEMNNVFVDSCFKNSAVFDAKTLLKKEKVIFGGRNLFLKRNEGKISREEYQREKLMPLYSVGEINYKGNRKFQIIDENKVLFKPSKKEHIILKIQNKSRNYKKKINRLIELQNNKEIAITYKLDLDYIYISFDSNKIENYDYNVKSNRVFAIDMNPNYIGYSVVDWKDETKYKVINSGVFDLKALNDKDNELKVSSTDSKRIYINNKRDNETIDIAYKLFSLCRHFGCESFAIENLNVKREDKKKGKRINRLINNQWNRNKFVSVLRKLVGCSSTNLIEVMPQYSSILGNLIYRKEQKPDMVLASIEISRRGFEFNRQYITKEVEKQKNIIQPNFNLVKDSISKSLEELNIESKVNNYRELYSSIKESKLKYRFSLDDCRIKQCSFSKSHRRSMISCYNY